MLTTNLILQLRNKKNKIDICEKEHAGHSLKRLLPFTYSHSFVNCQQKGKLKKIFERSGSIFTLTRKNSGIFDLVLLLILEILEYVI